MIKNSFLRALVCRYYRLKFRSHSLLNRRTLSLRGSPKNSSIFIVDFWTPLKTITHCPIYVRCFINNFINFFKSYSEDVSYEFIPPPTFLFSIFRKPPFTGKMAEIHCWTFRLMFQEQLLEVFNFVTKSYRQF